MDRAKAAELLGVPKSVIDDHVRGGRLTRFVMGKTARISRKELAALAAKEGNK
jgi:excisionase family DNA binding protein